MGFADTAMYCCVMAAMGPDVIPVMVTLNIAFLRPVGASDLIAEARIVRRGGRLHDRRVLAEGLMVRPIDAHT